MCNVFNGYELLLFKWFQSRPVEWKEWRNKLKEREDKGIDSFGDIPQELWFLSVTLHQRPRYLLQLVRFDIGRDKKHQLERSESLLTKYISMNHFTEFHLDSIFHYGDDNSLPKEIFRCVNLRYLSLKYNFLYEIPPDVGRLQKLEFLALTNNRLHVQSIPYTLIFCVNLKTLLLDNNLLDALPGFLLEMTNLETVHRHGNHNYFKSTFMWYHTDVHHRIIPVYGIREYNPGKPPSLSFWTAKVLVASKKNFFADKDIPSILKDYICNIYEQFNVCQNCQTSALINKPGFKVITFKNPYLGNTCVPFQHWVCSQECARSLEVPARLEQIAKAQELDSRYEDYICKCTKVFKSVNKKRSFFSWMSSNRADNVVSENTLPDSYGLSDCDSHSSISTELSERAKSNSGGKNCVLM